MGQVFALAAFRSITALVVLALVAPKVQDLFQTVSTAFASLS